MVVPLGRSHRATPILILALLVAQGLTILAPSARATCVPSIVSHARSSLGGIAFDTSAFVVRSGEPITFLVDETSSSCATQRYESGATYTGEPGTHVAFCFSGATHAPYDCATASGCNPQQAACGDGILIPDVAAGFRELGNHLSNTQRLGPNIDLHTLDGHTSSVDFLLVQPPQTYPRIDVSCRPYEDPADAACGAVGSDLVYYAGSLQAMQVIISPFWEPNLSAYGVDRHVASELYVNWFPQRVGFGFDLVEQPQPVSSVSAATASDGSVSITLGAPVYLGHIARPDTLQEVQLDRVDPDPATLAVFPMARGVHGFWGGFDYATYRDIGVQTVTFVDTTAPAVAFVTYSATVRTDVGSTTTTFSTGCDASNPTVSPDCCKHAETFQSGCCDAYPESYNYCCQWQSWRPSCHCDAPTTLSIEYTATPYGFYGDILPGSAFYVRSGEERSFLVVQTTRTNCGPLEEWRQASTSWTGEPGTPVEFCFDWASQSAYACADASECVASTSACAAGALVPDYDAAAIEFQDRMGASPLQKVGATIDFVNDIDGHTGAFNLVPTNPSPDQGFGNGAVRCYLRETGLSLMGAECGGFDQDTMIFTSASPNEATSIALHSYWRADFASLGINESLLARFQPYWLNPLQVDFSASLVHPPQPVASVDAQPWRRGPVNITITAPPFLGIAIDDNFYGCNGAYLQVDRLDPEPAAVATVTLCQHSFRLDDSSRPTTIVLHDVAPAGSDVRYVAIVHTDVAEALTEFSVTTPGVVTPDPIQPSFSPTYRKAGSVSAFWGPGYYGDESGAPTTRYRVDTMRAGYATKSTTLTGIELGRIYGTTVASIGNNALVKLRIRATNVAGDSAWENVTATSYAAFAPARSFTASFQDANSTALVWDSPSFTYCESPFNCPAGNRVAGIPTSYRIERATTMAGPWRLVGEVDKGFWNGVVDNTYRQGEPRVYRVAAFGLAGRGAWAYANVTDAPAALPPPPPTEKSCAVKSSNGWICTPGENARATSIAAGGWHSCVRLADGNLDCWGLDRSGESQDLLSRNVASVAAGPSATCAILVNRNVNCYGANIAGSASPRLEGDAVGVALGAMHGCIVVDGGNAHCRGLSDSGAADSRTNGDVLQAAAGKWHTCFLLVSGNVACQGDNTYGQLMTYLGGDAIKVVAGSYHTCVLTSAGVVTCVGYNAQHQSDGFPSGALDISAGAYFTCAIVGVPGGVRDVTCNGDNSGGQSTAYLGGDAVAIAAGEMHLCILVDSGRVECQGSDIGMGDAGQGTSYPSQKQVIDASAALATSSAPGLAGMLSLGTLAAAPFARGRGRVLAAALLIGLIPFAGAQAALPALPGLPTSAPLVLGQTIGPGQTQNLSQGSYFVTGLVEVAAGGLLVIDHASLDFASGAGITVDAGGRLEVADSSLGSTTSQAPFPVTLEAGSIATLERSTLNGTTLTIAADEARLDRDLITGPRSTFTLHESDAIVSRSEIQGLPVGLRVEGGAPQILDTNIRNGATCVEDVGSAGYYHQDLLDACGVGMALLASHVTTNLVAFRGAGSGTGIELRQGASVAIANDAIQGWDVGIANLDGEPLDPTELTFSENALDVDAPLLGDFPES